MKINMLDKIKLIIEVYKALFLFPDLKKKISLIFRPFDAPRYIEFAYLKKFIEKNNLVGVSILDVSSPYVMSYILSKKNKVTKTDIDSSEERFINENNNLKFKIEDATNFTFSDNTFDLVYSVSVIEHIYENYMKAIKEMLRVVKRGGYVYITFPVSNNYIEEWVDGEVYEKQHKENNRTFFQYRFDKDHVEEIMNEIKKENTEVLYADIFWESKDGLYNDLISKIKTKKQNIYINFIKDFVVNFYYGFNMFSKRDGIDFKNAKSCGNMHIILQKK